MTHNKGTNSEAVKASSQYVYLDLIRGIAALAVFAGHLRIICFRDVDISTLDLLGKGVFFLTGFGHLAVILFFVLSGFLIIKSIDESVIKKQWSVKTYGQNRLFRLWIVLIPCLLLG
jgi:peptidoglycan/LPS O-acetylase OafA/YrhL